MNHTQRIEAMEAEAQDAAVKIPQFTAKASEIESEINAKRSALRRARGRLEIEATVEAAAEVDRIEHEISAREADLKTAKATVENYEGRLDYARAEIKAAKAAKRVEEQEASRQELHELIAQAEVSIEALGAVMVAMMKAEERAKKNGTIHHGVHIHDPSYIHQPYQVGRTMQTPVMAQYLNRLRSLHF
jgi:chromosome segregation ATPase